MTCPTCKGERWVCERHKRPRGHDYIYARATLHWNTKIVAGIESCKSACDPCPTCNKGSSPEMPPGFIKLVEEENDK